MQFRGYELDADRVPTFLYSQGETLVRERFNAKKEALTRQIKWDSAALKDLEILHPAGVTISEAPLSTAGNRTYIYSWK